MESIALCFCKEFYGLQVKIQVLRCEADTDCVFGCRGNSASSESLNRNQFKIRYICPFFFRNKNSWIGKQNELRFWDGNTTLYWRRWEKIYSVLRGVANRPMRNIFLPTSRQYVCGIAVSKSQLVYKIERVKWDFEGNFVISWVNYRGVWGIFNILKSF